MKERTMSVGLSASLADGRGVDKPSVNTELWPFAGLAELLLHSTQIPLLITCIP